MQGQICFVVRTCEDLWAKGPLLVWRLGDPLNGLNDPPTWKKLSGTVHVPQATQCTLTEGLVDTKNGRVGPISKQVYKQIVSVAFPWWNQECDSSKQWHTCGSLFISIYYTDCKLSANRRDFNAGKLGKTKVISFIKIQHAWQALTIII